MVSATMNQDLRITIYSYGFYLLLLNNQASQAPYCIFVIENNKEDEKMEKIISAF